MGRRPLPEEQLAERRAAAQQAATSPAAADAAREGTDSALPQSATALQQSERLAETSSPPHKRPAKPPRHKTSHATVAPPLSCASQDQAGTKKAAWTCPCGLERAACGEAPTST
eukprot:4670676-Pleurochrysis_carterae.AAC.1